jgi:hypothetical protein
MAQTSEPGVEIVRLIGSNLDLIGVLSIVTVFFGLRGFCCW